MLPSTSPLTITWLPVSLVGLSRMGFIRTSGSTPAASACTTWARPISSPSRVIKRIEGHVLGFEGGHPVAVLVENPAQPGRQQAFPRVGHGALYHDRFCHHTLPPCARSPKAGPLQRLEQPQVFPARAHRHPVLARLSSPAVIAAAADQDPALSAQRCWPVSSGVRLEKTNSWPRRPHTSSRSCSASACRQPARSSPQ